MPAAIEPPELASLLDTAERARAGGWSLRSALARYAQSQPRRVGAVLEVLRRIQAALRPHLKRIRADGHAVYAAVGASEEDDPAVCLLRALVALDRLGDRLAAWAVDPSGDRPDDEVDAVVDRLADDLDRLGVPREDRQERARQPRRGRG